MKLLLNVIVEVIIGVSLAGVVLAMAVPCCIPPICSARMI